MDFLAARSAFLDHFADKTKPYYQSISRLYHHPDGVYSKGYMWEVLTPAYVIHYAKALELLASHERILVLADSLKPSAVYPLRVPAVSVTSGAKLCEALDYGKIPPPYGNLYVFDEDEVLDAGISEHTKGNSPRRINENFLRIEYSKKVLQENNHIKTYWKVEK